MEEIKCKNKWELLNKRNSYKKEVQYKIETEKEREDIISKDSDDEVWVDVPGYFGKYQVSDSGRIRTMPITYRLFNDKLYKTKFKIMNLTNVRGYNSVSLTNLNGKKTFRGVHRWMMFSFKGEVGEDVQVNHINGIKNDNRLDNLEYVSVRENNHHKKVINPDKYSSKHTGVFLSKDKGRKEIYKCFIILGGVKYYLGQSENDFELSLRYKEALKKWELNKEVPKKLFIENKTSVYEGVGYHSASGKYRVRYKDVYICLCKTEELANRVHSIVKYLVENRRVHLDKEIINKVKKKFTIDKRLKN